MMKDLLFERSWFVAVLAVAVIAADAQAQSFPTELYDNLRWENIGPARGGRSTAVAGSDARPLEFYFGAAGGGLWKSSDAGTTWDNVTDHQIESASVGAVQVCAADPDVVYIGTGETQLRGNIQQGDGVYRSEDGGETWSHLGLREGQNFARIRIHPNDCETAWVAALGKHSAPNPERGVYKTTDGGQTWSQVLYRDERTGAVDITMEPGNPDVLYAGMWEAWRKSWGMSSGGPGGGLFKSVDGGDTWTELTQAPGMPEGVLGKIGVAVSPADPDRVWALIENDEGGVFRSDDAGLTWERINADRNLRQRAFYYTRVYADPSGSGRDVRAEHRVLSLDGRRRDLHRNRRTARRQSRSVGLPQRPRPHDRIKRRRRQRLVQRGRELDRSGLADGPVLQGHDDEALPLSHLWCTAGQLHGLCG